jgi:molybdopterin molybdotransferase
LSALVSYEVFLRLVLRAAMGYSDTTRVRVCARLTEPLDSHAGKRQFRRGSLDLSTATEQVVGPPGSHFLRPLANSDCLLEIAEDITHLDAGAEVTVWSQRD